jgi:hypothetical protein
MSWRERSRMDKGGVARQICHENDDEGWPGRVTWRVSRWPGADVSRRTGTSPPRLVDQDLALIRVQTPRGSGVPCPHASRRSPP